MSVISMKLRDVISEKLLKSDTVFYFWINQSYLKESVKYYTKAIKTVLSGNRNTITK